MVFSFTFSITDDESLANPLKVHEPKSMCRTEKNIRGFRQLPNADYRFHDKNVRSERNRTYSLTKYANKVW